MASAWASSLKVVGGWFGALVLHRKEFALLDESELGVGAAPLDGAGSHIAGDAQMARVGLVAPWPCSSVMVT